MKCELKQFVCPVRRALWWWTTPLWRMWRWRSWRMQRDRFLHLPRTAPATIFPSDCWWARTVRGERSTSLWWPSPGTAPLSSQQPSAARNKYSYYPSSGNLYLKTQDLSIIRWRYNFIWRLGRLEHFAENLDSFSHILVHTEIQTQPCCYHLILMVVVKVASGKCGPVVIYLKSHSFVSQSRVREPRWHG